MQMNQKPIEGILLVDKPAGKTSFSLISCLRKVLNVQKIGHAGTLDPMATGVMVLLIGKRFTTLSDTFLNKDKEYIAEITLGVSTDSYDACGQITKQSSLMPTLKEIENALDEFQGYIEQTPPMFSAKKIDGKRLYELARQGKEIERAKVKVFVTTTLISYCYPKISLRIACSKGTYVRSIAHDLGQKLTSEAHLSQLIRTKSGSYTLEQCLSGKQLFESPLAEAKSAVLAHLQIH
jgi:tRNA pseudouridine55 synthase